MQQMKSFWFSSILKKTMKSVLLRTIGILGLLLASSFTVSLASPAVDAASRTADLPSHHTVPYQSNCLNIYGNTITTIASYYVSGRFAVDNTCGSGISGTIDLFVSVYNCTFDAGYGSETNSLYYNLGPGKTRGVGYTGFGQCLECPNKTRYSTFTILIQTAATDHSVAVQLAQTNLLGSSTSLHGSCGTDVSGNLSYTYLNKGKRYSGRLQTK